MKRKRKATPASATYIKIGDLFGDLPNDLHEAASVMEQRLKAAYAMNCEQMREFVLRVHRTAWARLTDAAAHDQETGPKGPRLPAGVTFVILLPHLAEAKRILASKEIPFEQWVNEHPWPAGVKVPPSKTVRTWLTRYGDLLYLYEPTNTKGERRTGF